MVHFIMVRKWLDPMTGTVWADEAIPADAPGGNVKLHELQYAKNTKSAPKPLAMQMISSGAWQKVGEYEDGVESPSDQVVDWKAKGAAVTQQPPVGPTLKEQGPAKPLKTAASVKDKA